MIPDGTLDRLRDERTSCVTAPNMRKDARVKRVVFTVLVLVLAAPPFVAGTAFVELRPVNTPSGYLATLLINETPFPGENGYVSEENTRGAMLAVLWVLHCRIHYIPPGYTQVQVAGLSSKNIIDVITGTPARRQCEGFYRDASGRFICAPRVRERINYLLNIANGGGKPGRFASLLNYAKDLAEAYINGGMEGADRFVSLRQIKTVVVTGRAYSWMTDCDYYQPGGNFVSIPDRDDGSLGGNRFFTLRKSPK
jgi:hypothetical protein